MKGFLLSCLIILICSQAGAQTHTFEIRFANHPIGNVTAVLKVNGTDRKIAIQTKVDMTFSHFNLDINCEYENNILMHAHAVRTSGKTGDDKSITTQRDGKNYSVIQNGGKSMINNTEIMHSVAELYFEEPRQITRIFSEMQGTFLPLRSLGNGEYELSLPDGKKNVYKYEKGVLVQVEIPQAMGKAVVVKVS